MKIAIIGAGVSGLSCAFQLKKYGIIPTIFEKRYCIGEPLGFGALIFDLFNKGIKDPFEYLKKKYSLSLTPSTSLKTVDIITENANKTFKSKFGYIVIRGDSADSIENQIYDQLNVPINFNTYITLNDIKDKYDYIVVASGGKTIPFNLGAWTTMFHVFNRVATVVGNFDKHSSSIWFNTKYANKGFTYLVPEGPDKAKLSLVCSDIAHSELDHYWKVFLENENINYQIIETRDMEHYAGSGYVYPVQIENVLLVGNAAGMTDSFIGNGTLKAIQSGLIAGECIANKLDYNKAMLPIINELRLYNEFRKAINNYDNSDYDRLISILHFPLINSLVYKNPFFKLYNAGFAAKLLKKP